MHILIKENFVAACSTRCIVRMIYGTIDCCSFSAEMALKNLDVCLLKPSCVSTSAVLKTALYAAQS